MVRCTGEGSLATGDAGQARAADAIVDVIERRIAEGELENQEPLPSERALMEEFGASRTVVREALTALSSRSLIVRKPRHRPVVRRVGYDTVLDATNPIIQQLLSAPGGVRNLYDVRIFVEKGLVRNAAENAGKADIQALKSALLGNKEAISNSDAFYVTDVAFHRVLYTIGGNPIFPAVHEGFVSWLAPHWARMKRLPEHNARIYEAHAAVYQAILERDPDAAEAALVSHFDVAWEFVKSTFGKSA